MTTANGNDTAFNLDFLEKDLFSYDHFDIPYETTSVSSPDKWKERYYDDLDLWEMIDSYSSCVKPQEKAESNISSLPTSVLNTVNFNLMQAVPCMSICGAKVPGNEEKQRVASEPTSCEHVLTETNSNTIKGNAILEGRNETVKYDGNGPQLSGQKAQRNIPPKKPMKVILRIVEKTKGPKGTKRKKENIKENAENIDPAKPQSFKKGRTPKHLLSSSLSSERPATQTHEKYPLVTAQPAVSEWDKKTNEATASTQAAKTPEMFQKLQQVTDTGNHLSSPSSFDERSSKKPHLMFAVPTLDDILPDRHVDLHKVLPPSEELQDNDLPMSPLRSYKSSIRKEIDQLVLTEYDKNTLRKRTNFLELDKKMEELLSEDAISQWPFQRQSPP